MKKEQEDLKSPFNLLHGRQDAKSDENLVSDHNGYC